MRRRVFVIHGWGAGPDRGWFPWLRHALEGYDVDVIIPAMPDTNHPTIAAWVGALQGAIGEPRSTDIFVGHSIGCQTILRYLAQERAAQSAGLICVAGWFTLRNLENKEEELIAAPWLSEAIDFDAVRQRTGPITAIFSDTDPYVALTENRDIFERALGAQSIIEHNMGHFSEDNNVYELPVVRDQIVALLG